MKTSRTGVLGITALSLLLYCCDEKIKPEPSVDITLSQVSVSSGTHNWQTVSATIDSKSNLAIESHGFVYGQNSLPTVEDSKVVDLGPLVNSNFFLYFNGDTEIEPDTDYYVRAFVKLEDKIRYSDQAQFHSLRGHWKKLSSFPGKHRRFSIAFSVGGKIYVVGGINRQQQKFNDVWCYDPTTATWNAKNVFPLSSISNTEATHFIINDVSYVVSAEGFWKYDSQNDEWQKIGSGINQTRMMSFTINGKGYVGYGHFDGPLITYNPLQNLWTTLLKTQASHYPGDADFMKYSWSVNGKAFSGYGTNSSFEEKPIAEFYEYDPVANKWTARKSVFYYNQPRWGVTHFPVNNKVYVGMGRNTNDAVLGDLYEYDESANDWIIVASIPSAPRVDAFSCFTATKAYVGLGLQYYQGGQVDELTDFWEFTP